MSLYKRVIVAGVALLLAAGGIRSLHAIQTVQPVAADYNTLPTIVIDPGHGGMDGGAVTPDGAVVEKDINLNMALTLRDLFIINGFDVVLTRDTDISIHDEGVQGVKKQKTSDLHNRLAIVERYPDAIFISIHQNKFGDSKSWGTQVFYSPNNPQSQRLAELVQGNTRRWMQPDNQREIKPAGKNLYLMYTAKCPSILVECGFLSNPADAANLTDSAYQAKICFTVLASVLEFLELDTPVIVTGSME